MSRFHDRINRRRWAIVREQVRQRDGYRCQDCGKAGFLEVDHIIPLGEGGAYYDPNNLQCLCRPCHFKKSAAELQERLARRKHQPWQTPAQRRTKPGRAAWLDLMETTPCP